ncbi:MAG: radical SAM protein [Paracoccaceae bacterium]
MNQQSLPDKHVIPLGKFEHPEITASGRERASVPLLKPETLWFNTGTLCNIECVNCYIESSPTNDRLVYLTTADVENFLDQIDDRKWPVGEIGFTGGEPFVNPDIIAMARLCLARGYRVLILTNAMRPMMRERVRAGLLELGSAYADALTLRVSLDHWSAEKNDELRGDGSFEVALHGLRWLRDNGFRLAVAGRTLWGESEEASRAGFSRLFRNEGFDIDAGDPSATVLFPEMDDTADVPEITTDCWRILGKQPRSVMCSSSRMVIRRKGAAAPTVIACTLLPYAPEFDLGPTLENAERPVRLNHPHCAKFCVLGGASCSA